MRKTATLSTLLVSFILSAGTFAQTYSGFSDATSILKSDTSTRSVLISNLLADRVGDISPIIGAAAWIDNNQKLQCRSLLYFEYGILPMLIKPEQITEAKLILRPLELNTVETSNGDQPSNFVVRRVLEPWEDSMTSWLTQPISNPADEAIKSIPEHKKGKPVRIDVTEIVRNMFRYGNNGFMITYKDSLEASNFWSHWFASARYENKKLRPELLISYSLPFFAGFPNDRFPDMAPMPRDLYRTGVNMTSTVIPMPVTTNENPPPPPKGPVSNEPPPPPPPKPVKTDN